MKRRLPPNLELRGDVYRYRFKVDGKTRRINLHTRNFNEAMVKYREILASGSQSFCNEGHTPGSSRPTVTWDAMRTWDLDRAKVASRRPEMVEKGLGSSWARLRFFFADAWAVSNDTLGNYARKQLDAGLSSASIKRDLYAIMRGYEWARDQLPELPLFKKKLKMRKSMKNKAQGRFIESKDLEAVVRQLAPLPAMKLMIALTTGIRAEEFKRIDKAWVKGDIMGDDQGPMLHLPEGSTKNWNPRMVPLSPAIYPCLKDFPDFTTDYRKAWATAAKKAGVEPVRMRDLRHTFASTMAPVDKYGVDLVMGHTDVRDAVGQMYQHGTESRLWKLGLATLKAWPWVLPLCIDCHDNAVGWSDDEDEEGVTPGITVPFDAKLKVPNSASNGAPGRV